MFSLAMLGAHVLIDQLPVLKNAVTNVTMETMIFVASMAGVFLMHLLVSPQSGWAAETCLAALALVGLFSRVQINVILQVTLPFECHVAYPADMLRRGRFTGFVDLVVLVLEGLLNFGRNQFDRGVRRFRNARMAWYLDHLIGLNLPIIIDRITSEFVIVNQAVHDGILHRIDHSSVGNLRRQRQLLSVVPGPVDDLRLRFRAA